MKFDYYSFLLCVRPDKVDIYHNGIPVGEIINGQFVAGNPPANIELLKEEVRSFIEQIKIDDAPKPAPTA